MFVPTGLNHPSSTTDSQAQRVPWLFRTFFVGALLGMDPVRCVGDQPQHTFEEDLEVPALVAIGVPILADGIAVPGNGKDERVHFIHMIKAALAAAARLTA